MLSFWSVWERERERSKCCVFGVCETEGEVNVVFLECMRQRENRSKCFVFGVCET